jgi:hypothetical protein
MALEDKIKQLQEMAKQLQEGKKSDMEMTDVADSKEDGIEDEDEKEGKKKEASMPVKESKEVAPIDLGSLFEGSDLSEEFKTKATTIFEAAVGARVEQIRESLEEELAQRALTESAELTEGLVEKVDGYLDFIVEQWIKNNDIALERGIKAEIFESFIGKMRDVFVEHNINLPDEEFSLVESLQDKAEALEKNLDEQVAQNIELTKTIKQFAKQAKIEEACSGMTDIDAEKFALLAEEIQFDDEESFANKLNVIRENYVPKQVSQEAKQLTEDVTQGSNDPVDTVLNEGAKLDPTMARYVSAMSRK